LQRQIIVISFLLFQFQINFAQNIETANNNQDKSLSLIQAFISNTLQGNYITDFNDVNIDTKKAGKYTAILKILKFANLKKHPFLKTESDTILFNKKSRKFKDTPANRIIKKVIKNRKTYLKKTAFYTANFYAKNIYTIKNAPKKLIGINFNDFNGSLDSTRSGTIYQSETLSKIIVKRNQLQENIKAVKINGLTEKTGFNRAKNVQINLYKNIVTLGDKIISPIANYAPLFYKYKIIDTLLVNNHKIFKIKVIPRHKIANVFNGELQIVANSWQLYDVALRIDGKQIQQPTIDYIYLKQQFKYNDSIKLYVLSKQQIDFKFSQFSVNLNGSLFSQYQNYQFNKVKLKPALLTYDLRFEKPDSFWKQNRPVKLSDKETLEYAKKDKLYQKRNTKKYLDSVTDIKNKFLLSDILFDYIYLNLYKNYRFKVSFPVNIQFNTVQGWNTTAMLQFFKDKNHQNYNLATKINYGFSDKQLRVTGHFNYRFNDKVNSILSLNFGRQLTEFNNPYSTAPLFNTLSTLLFEENNSKYYNKLFAELIYHQEITNGIFIHTKLAYENRKPEFNHANFVLINYKNQQYTSNNPLEPANFTKPVIAKHNMLKFGISTTFKIGQKYLLFPDRKVNLPTSYPQFSFNYVTGKSFTDNKYNFDYIEGRLFQKFKISNKGIFTYNVKAGKFLHKKELSFVDYKHFDITQVHISLVKDYTNHFALLPNYAFSTDNKFAEFHVEHNFNGYVFDKIPLLKQTQFKLIVGANTLLTVENFPYSEFNIGLNNLGFGKYRFLRIDYVRTFIQNKSTGSFIFGISL
jgi:hypothetical protein